MIEEEAQDPTSFPCVQIRPHALIETPARLGHGPAYLADGGGCELGYERLVGRVLDGESLVAFDPLPRDEGSSFFEDPPLSHATRPRHQRRTCFYHFKERRSSQAFAAA